MPSQSSLGNKKAHSLFISDLHLCPSRPHITQAFLSFINTHAIHAEHLYILGDLFEYWAGDDDITDHALSAVFDALRDLSVRGTRVAYMHGNRDFLIGQAFANHTGMQLLRDPIEVNLYGFRLVLSHGDLLCTDDIEYQKFRNQVRTPAWINQFLSQPLLQRKAFIESIRQRSEYEKSNKASEIMDANLDAIHSVLSQYQYPDFFIHGHTHRPMQHLHHVDGHCCTRWVLGDWYDHGSCLRLDAQGCHAIQLTM